MGVDASDTFFCAGSHGNSTEKLLSGGVYRRRALFCFGSAEADSGGVVPQARKQANVIKLEKLSISFICSKTHLFANKRTSNAGLQLRRAISIHAERIRLLEKHARAVSCKALLGGRCRFIKFNSQVFCGALELPLGALWPVDDNCVLITPTE